MKINDINGEVICVVYGTNILEAVQSACAFKANLSKANLQGANLYGANLRSINLYGANLKDADLRRANLIWAELSRSNLSGADLSKASLNSADMHSANLSSANLNNADLRRVDLQEANLSNADLRECNLNKADLRKINVTDAYLNWKSHDLIAEILRQEANDIMDLRKIAGLVLMSRDLCWGDFARLCNSDPNWSWALDILASYIRNGDGAPEILKLIKEKMVSK